MIESIQLLITTTGAGTGAGFHGFIWGRSNGFGRRLGWDEGRVFRHWLGRGVSVSSDWGFGRVGSSRWG